MSQFSLITSRVLCNFFSFKVLWFLCITHLSLGLSTRQTDLVLQHCPKRWCFHSVPSNRADGCRVCKRLQRKPQLVTNKPVSTSPLHLPEPHTWFPRERSPRWSHPAVCPACTHSSPRPFPSCLFPLHPPFLSHVEASNPQHKATLFWPPQNLGLIMGATSCRRARKGRQHRNTAVKCSTQKRGIYIVSTLSCSQGRKCPLYMRIFYRLHYWGEVCNKGLMFRT